MVPIIGIVGRSGEGKTTLLSKVIEEISSRGYEVAAIKHSRHPVEIDHQGKDSMKMSQAGAKAVAVASQGRVAMYMGTDQEWLPEDIAAKLFPEADLVLVEGFSQARIPKIGVLRKDQSREIMEKKGLIALVTDVEIETSLPCYSPEQITEIGDLLEGYIRRLGPRREVRLYVNEKKIFIKPFIKDFFLKTISAMVDSLKGTQDANRITIVIDKPRGEAEEEE